MNQTHDLQVRKPWRWSLAQRGMWMNQSVDNITAVVLTKNKGFSTRDTATEENEWFGELSQVTSEPNSLQDSGAFDKNSFYPCCILWYVWGVSTVKKACPIAPGGHWFGWGWVGEKTDNSDHEISSGVYRTTRGPNKSDLVTTPATANYTCWRDKCAFAGKYWPVNLGNKILEFVVHGPDPIQVKEWFDQNTIRVHGRIVPGQ